MDLGKVPPQDIEAEQAVIGSMLTDQDAVFIKFLSIAFSSTIFMYLSTFAVVGTLSGRTAIYSSPPTASNLFIEESSAFRVIMSIGSALL